MQFKVVDIERIQTDSPESAVRAFEMTGKPKVVPCDVFIAGGGMGGIAAAIRAAKNNMRVCISEETSWIGGQMTAQGVSALDENYMVEKSGATRLYQKLREEIREHYQTKNPGDCWVSWLAFEPKIGLEKLTKLIAEEAGQKHIDIRTRTKVVQVKVIRGRVKSVVAVNLDSGKFVEYRPRFCIDATELGDLLPLLGLEYASGAESRTDTGEPHAPETANPENVQDFTYPFVIEFRPGEKHLIPKPSKYDDFNDAGKFSFMGYRMFEKSGKFLPFWTYRRLIAHEKSPDFDLSMINWESNDLRGENIVDAESQTQAKRLAHGKLISLGFLYWLQTEAPRDDGGTGYPELLLRPDVLDTTDGLSKYPYIRESRRLKAKKIVVEQEIAAATNNGARAKLFNDSVGIGLYPIDIHGHQDVPGAGQSSKPFQIPLGAFVQSRIRNFLPACKNIGTTHVTNGAYRLHPIEWAIGEAAGETAAFCVKKRTKPESTRKNLLKMRTIQHALLKQGAPLFWFDDIAINDPDFVATQFAALTGLVETSNADLHFRPDDSDNKGGPSRRETAKQLYAKAIQRKRFGRI